MIAFRCGQAEVSFSGAVPPADVAGRRAKRFKATWNIGAGFLGGGIRLSGEVLDLSTTGVLVRCSKDLEVGTTGRLGVDLGYDTIRVGAVVRRCIPKVGVAFEFTRMSPHDRELLRRLLMRLAASHQT